MREDPAEAYVRHRVSHDLGIGVIEATYILKALDDARACLREVVDEWDDIDDGNPISPYRRQGIRDRARMALPGYIRPQMARLMTENPQTHKPGSQP